MTVRTDLVDEGIETPLTQTIENGVVVERTTFEDLESKLWQAVNSLRGPVDPADFKTYVFPMLFWKWLSDTWDYEHERAVETYGDDLDDEIEADEHRFVLPPEAHWSAVTTKTAGNLGAHVRKAFTDIEQANQLARIFGDANWADQDRIPATAILGVVKALNGIQLSPTASAATYSDRGTSTSSRTSPTPPGRRPASSSPHAPSSTSSSTSSSPPKPSRSTTRLAGRAACSCRRSTSSAVRARRTSL
jgi:hypothetical protein